MRARVEKRSVLGWNKSSSFCMIILPWGKYWYNRLPMGAVNSPYIFQQKMIDLFHGFESIRAYIDDMSILTKGDWTDHVEKLELTLNKPKGKGLKFNIERSFFRQTEMESLGFWVTHNGVKPVNKYKSHNKYGATYFLKRGTKVYRCNKLLPQYVAKAVTCVGDFN